MRQRSRHQAGTAPTQKKKEAKSSEFTWSVLFTMTSRIVFFSQELVVVSFPVNCCDIFLPAWVFFINCSVFFLQKQYFRPVTIESCLVCRTYMVSLSSFYVAMIDLSEAHRQDIRGVLIESTQPVEVVFRYTLLVDGFIQRKFQVFSLILWESVREFSCDMNHHKINVIKHCHCNFPRIVDSGQ